MTRNPTMISFIVFVSKRKLTEASKLIDVMGRRSQIPHFPTCINITRGLIKVGQIEKAAKVMVMSGGVPDIITYNMLDQLRKGYPPYLITYTVLTELVYRHCGVERGIEVSEDMAIEGCYPNIVKGSMKILPCHGYWDEVDEILSIMNETSNPPVIVNYNILINGNIGYSPCLITYNIVIDGLAKKGDMKKATKL
ncbi:hypothetical protein HHK36_014652 [Tetracentron sinense]|uniref:Pentatricopeptide repeat-containing protein n=1 Tax=Tetracentron sinense TaxID=13715 RepID=A0A835DG10_TETSI|nr:hypothetical protein HHK36_014652 [Tetracentron sinense]